MNLTMNISWEVLARNEMITSLIEVLSNGVFQTRDLKLWIDQENKYLAKKCLLTVYFSFIK